MPIVATAHATSTAPPAAFFARWADTATWPEWNTDTAWVRLDGPFAEGATGALQPKNGPKVRFVIARLTDSELIDVSTLFGARLSFAHRVTATDGRTTITVTVSIDGPLRRLWNRILGADLAASVQPDLDALVTLAERGSGMNERTMDTAEPSLVEPSAGEARA